MNPLRRQFPQVIGIGIWIAIAMVVMLLGAPRCR